MKRQFRILLMLTLTLTSVAFIGVRPIGPVLANPDNSWSSYGTRHYVGGNLSVTNPKYAYDMRTFPPASYFDYIRKTGFFNITGFNSTTPLMTNPLPGILSVDFNLVYNATANTGDQNDKYRIVYYVGNSAPQVLTDWRTDNITYLYVDNFDGRIHYWQRTGASPYLGSVDSTNYINETVNGAVIGDFNFEDTTEAHYTGLFLQIYATTVGSPNPVRIYLWDTVQLRYRYAEFDTLVPSNTAWGWVATGYNFANLLDTSTKINSARLYLEKLGSGGNVKIDAMRFYAPPEYIYRDFNISGTVDMSDVRLTDVPPYFAGSTVAPTHLDVGNSLVAFAANEKHRENVAVNDPPVYDIGEYIYRDVDTNGVVSVNDVRLTDVPPYTAGSTVLSGNTDIGQTLVAFAANEKHRENIATNSQYDLYVQKYLYVNGWTEDAVGNGKKWARVGSPPYLGAADGTNYVYQIEGDGVIGDFSLANLPRDYGGKVYIEVNAKQPVTGDDKLEVWLYDEAQYYQYVLTPARSTNFVWNSTDDISANRLMNITRINNAKVYLVKKQVGATADRIDVDAVRLKIWNKGAMPVTGTVKWTDKPKPGGGAWTWSDIGNIKFCVETKHGGAGGAVGAVFYLQEAWLTITTPDAKLKVSPTSLTTTQAATSVTIRPESEGTYSEWNSSTPKRPSGDSLVFNNWTGVYNYWSENTPETDTDGSVVAANTGNLIESSTLTTFTNPTWSPYKVRLTVVARQTTGDEKLRLILVNNTITNQVQKMANGSIVQPPAWGAKNILIPYYNYTWYTSEWTTNPWTGRSWVWTEINSAALQAGVRSQRNGATWDGEIYVTQLYINVLPADLYTRWDETSQNGDGDYVNTGTSVPEKRVSSQLTDPTPPGWDPATVRVNVYAKTSDAATPDNMTLAVVVGGIEYQSRTDVTNITSSRIIFITTANYAKYSFDFAVNPRTKLPWTWSDINSLEAGVRSRQITGGEIRVTQLYVEVWGPRVEATVFAEDVWDMFSFKFSLRFNTTVLTPLGVVLYEPSMTPASVKLNDTAGYVIAQYNMGAGTKHSGGSSGNRTLAKVIFLPDAVGTTAFDLYNTALSNTDGQSIAHNVFDSDVDVTAVTPAATVAYTGYDRNITVTVKNLITVPYDVNVTIAYNSTEFGYKVLTAFAPGASTTFDFKWITTGLVKSDYLITVKAILISTPQDVSTKSGGIVRLTIPGDINGDKFVTSTDLSLLLGAYGKSKGQPGYTVAIDINADRYITSTDLSILLGNYGKHW